MAVVRRQVPKTASVVSRNGLVSVGSNLESCPRVFTVNIFRPDTGRSGSQPVNQDFFFFLSYYYLGKNDWLILEIRIVYFFFPVVHRSGLTLIAISHSAHARVTMDSGGIRVQSRWECPIHRDIYQTTASILGGAKHRVFWPFIFIF